MNDVNKEINHLAETVIVKSYYIISVKVGSKLKFISSPFSTKLVKSEEEAHKFSFFGLKGMEIALKLAMDCVGDLDSKKIQNTTIVGRDVEARIYDIKDENLRKSFVAWNTLINSKTIDGIINDIVEISKKDSVDEEATENYVSIYKFLSHIKSLDFKTVIVMALNWDKFVADKQVNLALHHAGEYNASRFMMFMDYLSEELAKGKFINK